MLPGERATAAVAHRLSSDRCFAFFVCFSKNKKIKTASATGWDLVYVKLSVAVSTKHSNTININTSSSKMDEKLKSELLQLQVRGGNEGLTEGLTDMM